MPSKKKSETPVTSKADLDMIRSSENLLIEKEKRYQKKIMHPQVEQQTRLRETKKAATKSSKKK